MRTEASICHRCRNQKPCHINLKPEILNDSQEIRPIPDKYMHIVDLDCRHITCDFEGKGAAIDAQLRGDFITQTVANGNTTMQIELAAFGTQDKPTKKLQLRGVSKIGQIFSKQGNLYYPTGQRT